MKTVGVIGFGSFGKFLAEQLEPHFTVLVYSASGRSNKWATSLEELGRADFILPAIPLSAYAQVLSSLKPHLSANSVIVDVCSVKEKPIQIIKSILPNNSLVVTHPLFGPESASKSLQGHTLVLCPEVSDQSVCKQVEAFAKSLGLDIVRMSAKEHDTEMATVQALTFFIARALDGMGLHEQKLATPSFQKLLSLAKLEEHHSHDLFETIQNNNAYAKDIRTEFIKRIQELDQKIND